METQFCFSILILTSAICIVVLTIYIAKLIISLTNLTNNANKITLDVQRELEPSLVELKQTITSINSIAKSTDANLKATKTYIMSILGASALFGGKIKGFTKGLLKGLSFVLSLLKRK